jgi:hypothetical protein
MMVFGITYGVSFVGIGLVFTGKPLRVLRTGFLIGLPLALPE